MPCRIPVCSILTLCFSESSASRLRPRIPASQVTYHDTFWKATHEETQEKKSARIDLLVVDVLWITSSELFFLSTISMLLGQELSSLFSFSLLCLNLLLQSFLIIFGPSGYSPWENSHEATIRKIFWVIIGRIINMKSVLKWAIHVDFSLHFSQYDRNRGIVLIFGPLPLVVLVCCRLGISSNINPVVFFFLEYYCEELSSTIRWLHCLFVMEMTYITSQSLKIWSGHQLPFLGVLNTSCSRLKIVLSDAEVAAFNDECNSSKVREKRISCLLAQICECSLWFLTKFHLKDRCGITRLLLRLIPKEDEHNL